MYLNYKGKNNYIIHDIETDSLDATKIHCAVFITLHDGTIHRCIGRNDVRSFMDQASKDTIWVGHNALSFDIPTCNRLLGTMVPVSRIVDTLVMSYLYWPRIPGGHSLEAYGERFKDQKVGLDVSFETYSQSLLERCEQDARLTLKLYKTLVEKMNAIGFSESSCLLEHEIRHVINKQERSGFYFDIVHARDFVRTLRDREEQLRETIHRLFPPKLERVGNYVLRTKGNGEPYASYARHAQTFPEIRHLDDGTYDTLDFQEFNIGSPQQRVQKLLDLGWKPEKFTKGGSPQVDEDSLKEFSTLSGIPEIKAIADYLVVSSRANMVDNWINHCGSDSRIHGRVFSCGAASRRMTHNAPNTANIPSNEAPFGRECRELWTVPTESEIKKVLLGYDAKSIQMRCFANVLPDPSQGVRYYDISVCPDPHQENADIIGIPRKPSKNVFYANLFGAYPPRLAATAGFQGSGREANGYGTWVRSEMYRVTPGLEEATREAQSEWRSNKGFLRCCDGGFVRCPNESAALNYRIQPLEAVVMKTASVMIDKEARRQGIDHRKVADIHDEGQHEVGIRDGKRLGEISKKAIKDAGEQLGFRVPLEGDYKIGRTWADTH